MLFNFIGVALLYRILILNFYRSVDKYYCTLPLYTISKVVYIYAQAITITAMKTVKKFTTFDELKSYEGKTVNQTLSLKKHKMFEKFIKELRSFLPNKKASTQL